MNQTLKHVEEKSNPKPESKHWLVEDFPVDLRWRCKRAASHAHTPLKKFVQKVMREAVEQIEAEMLGSAHESRKEEIRQNSEQADSSATGKTIRGKAPRKN